MKKVKGNISVMTPSYKYYFNISKFGNNTIPRSGRRRHRINKKHLKKYLV
jgi:hypothetical protein